MDKEYKMKTKILIGVILLGIALITIDIYFTNHIFPSKDKTKNIEYTLAIIKPDAVQSKKTGKIIDRIEQEKFEIIKIKKLKLTPQQAEGFYSVHKNKPFFKNLVNYITSGPIIVMILQKENAIEEWRKLMGETNPEKAEENTLRNIFGTDIEKNAVHGSDSPQTAKKEIYFFFPNFIK